MPGTTRCSVGVLSQHVVSCRYPWSPGLSSVLRSFASSAHALSKSKNDYRNRATLLWMPTWGLDTGGPRKDDGFSILIRAGFIRQAYAGIFHLLPLGLRVQTKLEHLIDRHMQAIGASKLSLSSISTEGLWRKSNRIIAPLEDGQHEFLSVNDRKASGFILSPTHEEEITELAASALKTYKELPLRLYQISRKYRDELRPRQGLLRAKEFLMKDLYTFDQSKEAAMLTYGEVRAAYASIFDELGLPYLVAEADSGNMGGKLSHEYHFVSPLGEDTVFHCSKCQYTANEEVVEKPVPSDNLPLEEGPAIATWRGVSADRRTLIYAHLPVPRSASGRMSPSDHVDMRAIKEVYPDTDSSVQYLTDAFLSTLTPTNAVHLVDHRLTHSLPDDKLLRTSISLPSSSSPTILRADPGNNNPLDLVKPSSGSACPRCETGTLTAHRCIEVGHTFHLGTRYSKPLNAVVASPPSSATGMPQQQVHVQMGCHGIGVSRLLGAIALLMSDSAGLRWPRGIAPFDAVVIAAPGLEADAAQVYDVLTADAHLDVLLDDRDKSLGWKLKDADLIGFSLVVVLGRAWKASRAVEIQCRNKPELGVAAAPLDGLAAACRGIMEKV